VWCNYFEILQTKSSLYNISESVAAVPADDEEYNKKVRRDNNAIKIRILLL
jgi:hypothetical protein